VQITSEAIRHFHPNARSFFGDRRDQYERILVDIIEEGTAAGEFQVTDAKIVSFAILQMLTGIASWYKPVGRLTPRQISDLYWELVCGMVHARDEQTLSLQLRSQRLKRSVKRSPKRAVS
jgi:hypothetical protein